MFGDGEKPKQCALSPRSCALVRAAFEGTGRLGRKGDTSWAFFSALDGTVDVVPHCGPNNRNLVLHLALQVPAGDYHMDVGGTKLEWAEGEVVLFDESFRHTVKARPEARPQDAPQPPRVVFIIRVPHPDLAVDS
eukprot:SAG11_NODE_14254_length_619_cov_1.765385_1_plen_135_part_00